MDNPNFLATLLDKKLLDIISYFVETRGTKLYLRQISKECNVSPATTYRILKRLTKLEILNMNQIGRFKFYQLNDNKLVKQLTALVSKDPLEKFVSGIKRLTGVKAVLLYGNKGARSANVMIIGNNLDNTRIRGIIEGIKTEFGFEIRYLAFSVNQFEQMTAMGMYSQPKRVLWKSI